MSPTINIDFDAEARDMDEKLGLVTFAIMASKAPEIDFDERPNFARALVFGIEVAGNANLILRWIEERDINNRERFMTLAKRAQKLVNKFWANFTLVNVHTVSGSNLSVAVPQKPQTVQDAPKGTYAKQQKPNPRKGTPHRIYTDDEVRTIKNYIKTVFGGKCTQAQIKEVAEACGASTSFVSGVYYGYTHKHIMV